MPIVGQFGSLAGLGSFLLPGGAFESIATVTVGSGGASSITFSDIPSGFQHLQVRVVALSGGTYSGDGLLRLNGDTSSSTSYAWHLLSGSGASATASAVSSTSSMYPFTTPDATYPVAAIIDILDYASTTKNKTMRSIAGVDRNGSGYIQVLSGLRNSTSAVTSMTFSVTGGNFNQYTTAALYGLRAP